MSIFMILVFRYWWCKAFVERIRASPKHTKFSHREEHMAS